MQRVYNFSAGPSMLPLPVLEKAASELVLYGDSGMSVMEMSHRSPAYERIIEAAEADLRALLSIPDNYRVLFLQGGATLQFSALPLNLLSDSARADYVVTGFFSARAAEEASKYGDIRIVATTAPGGHRDIPSLSARDFRTDADYVHLCQNNTIYGTRWPALPDTGGPPLVADLSSCLLSEPTDVSRYGAIYAGAQKNMGPAGLTVLIIRDDLLGRQRADTPAMLNLKLMAEHGSMYNTPPCYAIYVAGLVFRWLLDEVGGLEAMAVRNREKAALLYGFLDGQDYYVPHADKPFRSLMNVTFGTGDAELDKRFVQQAAAAGLKNLAGHRSVGGMRASIYNAMPLEGVQALTAFMARFAAENPKERKAP